MRVMRESPAIGFDRLIRIRITVRVRDKNSPLAAGPGKSFRPRQFAGRAPTADQIAVFFQNFDSLRQCFCRRCAEWFAWLCRLFFAWNPDQAFSDPRSFRIRGFQYMFSILLSAS